MNRIVNEEKEEHKRWKKSGGKKEMKR